MRKSECTPEQWATYCEKAKEWYHRNREAEREKRRARCSTEEARARRRAYDARPDVKAKRQARERSNGYHQRKWEKMKGDPGALDKAYAITRAIRTGMDRTTYDALLILQNNSCAICHEVFDSPRKGRRTTKGGRYPCADHCHDGGGARGLLCNYCNAAEGLIKATGLTPQEFCGKLHDYLSHPPVKRLVNQG